MDHVLAILSVTGLTALWYRERQLRNREAAANQATHDAIRAIDDHVLHGVLRDAGMPEFGPPTGPPGMRPGNGRHRATRQVT